MQITDYIKPELIVVALVLYFVGMWIKQSETVKDRYIPLINGGLGIAICGIYVLATSTCQSGQEIFMAIFTAITQGILLAGLSTYVNQIIKQAGREE
ncbi:MAG: phage holin family protein [Clostridia bacterium]|nr:phage holin family protein [Clostridia bacterium]